MSETLEFHLTEDHLKLIDNFNISWEDAMYYGAPAVDIKRPYGSKSVVEDMAKILGRNVPDSYYSDKEYNLLTEKMLKLHQETEIALQILVKNAKEGVRPGLYKRSNTFSQNWQRAN